MPEHVCAYCQETFDKPARLKRHELKHTGERPFVCGRDGCDKSYQRKDHMLRHQKADHDGGRDLLCGVDGCPAAFYEQSHLKRHRLTHGSAGLASTVPTTRPPDPGLGSGGEPKVPPRAAKRKAPRPGSESGAGDVVSHSAFALQYITGSSFVGAAESGGLPAMAVESGAEAGEFGEHGEHGEPEDDASSPGNSMHGPDGKMKTRKRGRHVQGVYAKVVTVGLGGGASDGRPRKLARAGGGDLGVDALPGLTPAQARTTRDGAEYTVTGQHPSRLHRGSSADFDSELFLGPIQGGAGSSAGQPAYRGSNLARLGGASDLPDFTEQDYLSDEEAQSVSGGTFSAQASGRPSGRARAVSGGGGAADMEDEEGEEQDVFPGLLAPPQASRDRTHDRLDEGAILAAGMKNRSAMALQPALESTQFECPFRDCESGSLRFPRRSDLKAHWKAVHEDDVPYCSLCGKAINNVNCMKGHGTGPKQCGQKVPRQLDAATAGKLVGGGSGGFPRSRGFSVSSYGARSEGALTVAMRGGGGKPLTDLHSVLGPAGSGLGGVGGPGDYASVVMGGVPTHLASSYHGGMTFLPGGMMLTPYGVPMMYSGPMGGMVGVPHPAMYGGGPVGGMVGVPHPAMYGGVHSAVAGAHGHPKHSAAAVLAPPSVTEPPLERGTLGLALPLGLAHRASGLALLPSEPGQEGVPVATVGGTGMGADGSSVSALHGLPGKRERSSSTHSLGLQLTAGV